MKFYKSVTVKLLRMTYHKPWTEVVLGLGDPICIVEMVSVLQQLTKRYHGT